MKIADTPINQKLVSLVLPTYNEIDNIDQLYRRICVVTEQLSQYEFEFLFIDNASTDGTIETLRQLASIDRRVKVIINTRNFGHIRSPYWGLMQAGGDAVIYLASDLQDPPELIPQLLEKWERGYKLVFGVKPESEHTKVMHNLRKSYYALLNHISDVPITKNATGFGLYDRMVIKMVIKINDPYPFFRGLVSELGYEVAEIPFVQPRRKRGLSKNNFYTLYDIAALGIIRHSLVPIRIATFSGFFIGLLSILGSLVMLFLKLLYWDSFPIGVAPIMMGMFFMFGILLIFIGILGEYIGSIHTYVNNRPIVVERERINF